MITANEAISGDNYEASALQAEPVIVTIPVKMDAGDVTIEEFASNADFKAAADLDHFMNKLFVGLRTPKTFLGYEEALPGMTASGSLLRMDIRYSRSVKKVQRVIINGIKELVRIYNEVLEIENSPELSYHILKVNSPEDEERYMEYESRMALANNVIEFIYNNETGQINIGKVYLLIKFFKDVVIIPEMVSYLEDVSKKVVLVKKPEGMKLTAPAPAEQAPAPAEQAPVEETAK